MTMTTNNTNEDIMAKNNKTSNATSDTSQDNLNKLFGDSVIVSSEPTTSKAKTSNEPLELARQEIKLASQKIMAKYGVRCSFVTTIPCGKNEQGQQLRKQVVKSGYYIPIKVNDTKLGIEYYEMKSNELATTFETSKTTKYVELED